MNHLCMKSIAGLNFLSDKIRAKFMKSHSTEQHAASFYLSEVFSYHLTLCLPRSVGKVLGTVYHILPAKLSMALMKTISLRVCHRLLYFIKVIDSRHSHFLTVDISKVPHGLILYHVATSWWSQESAKFVSFCFELRASRLAIRKLLGSFRSFC